ncbi:DUF1127 domain-containing protein [Tropicimonas sp. IMCC34011]|uniref:DUF1127 domain-containing protein n=1 Tax=Tropicimonas sp. IMCC34011 TaxID=2248759 RepID=UPI000E2322E6|nr:DUF1127 domain-containing protein [Tropicimonas sp. IMCC34011]
MAYAANTDRMSGTTGIFGWATAMFRRDEATRTKMKLYRQTRRELSNLTDRELADLGMHRSNIEGISREAAGL